MKLPLFVLTRIRDLPDNFRGGLVLHTNGVEWTFEVKATEHQRLVELVDIQTMLDYSQSLSKNQQ